MVSKKTTRTASIKKTLKKTSASRKKIDHTKNKHLSIFMTAVIIVFVLALVVSSKNMAMGKIKENFKQTLFGPPELSLDDLDMIYHEFVCTCCDDPLEDCECGLAAGIRKWFADEVKAGITMDELLIKSSKQYGMKIIEQEDKKEYVKELLSKQAGKNPPIIEIENPTYDFGMVKQTSEIISATFEIQNTGKTDLIIDNMDTSCMCTSASITYGGKEGPAFGMSMHGDNPKGWQVAIPPGESAKLNVYYDPMAHGIQQEESLSITRTITISSNDPINFQKEIRIELTQVK